MPKNDNSPDSTSQAAILFDPSVALNIKRNPAKYFKGKSRAYRKACGVFFENACHYSMLYHRVDTLARQVGVTRPYMHEILNQLEDDGVIGRIQREGTSNLYTVSSFFFQHHIRRALQILIPAFRTIPFFFLFSTYQTAAKYLLERFPSENLTQEYKINIKNLNSLSSGTVCNNEERTFAHQNGTVGTFITNLLIQAAAKQEKTMKNDATTAPKAWAPVINKSTHHKKDRETYTYNQQPQQKAEQNGYKRPERIPYQEPIDTKPFEAVHISYFKLKDHLEKQGHGFPNPYAKKYEEFLQECIKNTGAPRDALEKELRRLYEKQLKKES